MMPILLPGSVAKAGNILTGTFLLVLPTMGVDLDLVASARVSVAACTRGAGEIAFSVTRRGRPYAEQVRAFILEGPNTIPTAAARALCAAHLR